MGQLLPRRGVDEAAIRSRRSAPELRVRASMMWVRPSRDQLFRPRYSIAGRRPATPPSLGRLEGFRPWETAERRRRACPREGSAASARSLPQGPLPRPQEESAVGQGEQADGRGSRRGKRVLHLVLELGMVGIGRRGHRRRLVHRRPALCASRRLARHVVEEDLAARIGMRRRVGEDDDLPSRRRSSRIRSPPRRGPRFRLRECPRRRTRPRS